MNIKKIHTDRRSVHLSNENGSFILIEDESQKNEPKIHYDYVLRLLGCNWLFDGG